MQGLIQRLWIQAVDLLHSDVLQQKPVGLEAFSCCGRSVVFGVICTSCFEVEVEGMFDSGSIDFVVA